MPQVSTTSALCNRNSAPIKVTPRVPLPWPLGIIILFFCPYEFGYFRYLLYMELYIISVLFLPGSFHLAKCTQDSPILQHVTGFPSFKSLLILHRMPMPRSVIHPSISRHSDCVYLLPKVNDAIMNLSVQISLQDPAFNS